jgi:hypothetical protein
MRDLQLITSLTSRPDRTLLTAVECLVAWIGAATLLPRFDELFSRFFEPSPPR